MPQPPVEPESGPDSQPEHQPAPGADRPSSGVPNGFLIRAATIEDVPGFPNMELAAGVWFGEIGMESIADAEPPSIAELALYQQGGRCWVAARAERPSEAVAYLIAERVDGCAHIEQVSVHPDAAGHGLGRSLIDRAQAWAIAEGLSALTLTTFVEVAWNGPYYERIGFRFLDQGEESPGLRAIRAGEREHGLDRWPRACMRRELPGPEHQENRRGDDPGPPRQS